MNKKSEELLKTEIVNLRNEVRQLQQVVNLLLEMVIEHDGEEYDMDIGEFKFDRNQNLKMGM